MSVSVDFGPWEVVSNRFTEIGREYRFKNLSGPGTETRVELRCRLTVDSAQNRFRPFVYVIIDPYIVEQSTHAIAMFGPSDGLIDHKILTVKIEAAASGINFIVFDISDGEHLLELLMLSKQLTVNVILKSGETVASFPLENDATFKREFVSLQKNII